MYMPIFDRMLMDRAWAEMGMASVGFLLASLFPEGTNAFVATLPPEVQAEWKDAIKHGTRYAMKRVRHLVDTKNIDGHYLGMFNEWAWDDL